MSDPVTHAEIEDVLSSIRRLVSEDTRQQPAAPEPAARLVLTPALRVQESDAPVSGLPAAEPDAEQDTEAAEAVAKPAEPAEQAAEDLPQTGFEAQEQGGDTAAIADTAAAEDLAASLAPEPPLAFRHHRDRDIGRTDADAPQETAEDQAPSAAAADPAETDAPWGNPETTLFAAAAGAGQHADDEAGDEGTHAEGEADAEKAAPVLLTEESLASTTAGARAASVVRKIAELEARGTAAQNRARQHWEPDSQTEAPFAGAGPDTIEWRDEPLPLRRTRRADNGIPDAAAEDIAPDTAADPASAEAALDPETAADSLETAVEDAVTGAAMDTLAEEGGDSYLDEDALRDLVASIVREELQGPLGERITRNVRKLVRREIHRALAAHDLL
ncbi:MULTISPECIES: hypothetical protein [unclassified Leisingera]|uniref:hypothetical protein n=1 Tax=unclassified Leisingera TaxID=2614906 RepID=UPI000376B4C0|nr:MULTISPECIES: hypothetical protein [unclassified Leisingera]